LKSSRLILRPGRLRPGGDDALGVDDPLPGDVFMVEARVWVFWEVLETDADLAGPLG
jgi:hypothetical protein